MIKLSSLSPSIQVLTVGKYIDTTALTALVSAMARGKASPALILDLRQTLSMDTAGLAWLVDLKIATQRRRGSLVLLSPTPELCNRLEELDLLRVLVIAEDMPTAIHKASETIDNSSFTFRFSAGL